ncbi:MAG TPA: ATP-dependent Clp protease proteolytic subunit [Phototrophicaceae bacterium]|nr:ATP-dependent Clp protease proteolytic subunit [Phototrophicaceae bacterium]
MASYPVPYVTTQTPRGERTVDVYSRLLAERIVYLGTEIDDGVANTLIAQLIHLESESAEQPINFYINSPGGSVTAMLAVYDTMQYVSPPVATTCVGQAASSAAVLLAGGARGRRAMLPRARVVLHQPAAQGRGTVPDLILEAEELERVRSMLEELLARDTGRSSEQVRRDTERDLVLTAEAALAYGLVDRVLEHRPAPPAARALR